MTSPTTGRAPNPLTLRDAIAGSYRSYVDDLRTMVNIDCGTYSREGVNRVADLMQERFEATGWTVERHPHEAGPGQPQFGDVVVARLTGGHRQSDGGHRVLLIGHMDTVFPEGTVAERPFRIDGSTAFGPGVSDMKDGLLAGWYAVRGLQEAGFDGFDSITYVCNPDEELGSPFSGSIIQRLARDADVCFVLEGARENGDIVSARKGVADIRITVLGRAAHSGVEPERGRSAIVQAAHTIVALHDLNDRWPGVTVNVGVVEGGTRSNVVAERCTLNVDVRSPSRTHLDEAISAVERVARTVVVPDTTATIERRQGFPPMEKSEATARLVERARQIGAELGFEVRDAATGGASDANTVAAAGIPVLDGLGPIGGADHAPGEWVDLDSVVPRTALLAAMIASPFD